MQAVFLCGLMMGSAFVFVPRPSAEGAAEANADNKTAYAADASEAYDSWAAGETVLERRPDGHFYASVMIDGAETEMMVDTGASFIALTAADARDIGLSWREQDAIVVAHGASGPVKGVPVRLAEVELNGHIATNVEAAVIPTGLGVSLLGQSYLQKLERVEIAGETMSLGG
ncbi:retropepsin-like aspartic protease family protein [Qipengyuania atrilutea]|nr:TIGR02281 family clan AA aspartic protease [Actirhodobacter atriluteus]